VRWQGYVVRVILNEDDPMNMGFMAANIFVKMNENDQDEVFGADLGLSISESTLERIKDNLD
jgi:hypothetical protein